MQTLGNQGLGLRLELVRIERQKYVALRALQSELVGQVGGVATKRGTQRRLAE